jgi:antitoxin (DNA-binding transcriptional repressor) of toxin-antitoxin stability system
MKTMNLRDANQQFSKLVREIEETGESVLVLRNGKPAITLSAVGGTRRATTPEQREQAKQRLMDPGSSFNYPDDWKFNREEIYAETIPNSLQQVEQGDGHLSTLVAQVAQTGGSIEILRDGELVAELRPVSRSHTRKLTPEQEEAVKSILDTARRNRRKSDGRKMTRDEMHER